MVNYKIYFYDYRIKDSYPITIPKDNISELAKWLNNYIRVWHLQFVRGEVFNFRNEKLGDINFIPSEVESQRFITNLEERLCEFNSYHYEERGVIT